MIYLSQIIMLYTLNLYSAVCQIYLNKTGRKKTYIYIKNTKDNQQTIQWNVNSIMTTLGLSQEHKVGLAFENR